MAPTWDNSAHIRERARARLRRAAGPCWICGGVIDYSVKSPDPMSFELDHKKPKELFPELAFEPTNWAASHRKCNRAKSNREFAPIIRRSGALR
jgi:5-methylcytosine-specific restriction endonuclease McrA